MVNKNRLLSNTLLLSIGTIIPKVLMVILLPLYTFYLTKSELGIYDLAMNIVTLVVPIITLQIPSGVFRLLLDRKNKKEIISSAFEVIFFSTLISTVIFIFIPFNYGSTKYLLLSYTILTIIFQLLLEMCRGLNLKKDYAIAGVSNSILLAVLSIIFLMIFKLGIIGLLMAITISQLIADLYLIIKIRFISYISLKEVSKESVLELIKYSFPLIPNTLSWWIVNLSDRLLITMFLGIEANAVYAIANKIPSTYSLFYNAFNLSWQEDASLTLKQDRNKYYSTVFNSLLNVLFLGLILLISIIPLAFKILINASYAESYYQMPILCISLLFSSIATFLGGIYIAQSKTTKLGISTMVAAIINVTINLLLINKIGLYAASISTLISYLAISVYRYIDIKKTIDIKIDYKKYIKYILLLIFTVIIFYKKNLIVSILIFIIIFIVFFKKYIYTFLKKKVIR